MNAVVKPAIPSAAVPARRSLGDLLAALGRCAENSPNLLAKPIGPFDLEGAACEIPRYIFIGPRGGGDPIRVGLFAGLHGDEPEGARALVKLLLLLDSHPELARDYCLFVYPICNPTGYEDRTRCSRRGRDLNREFWNNSSEPEVQWLERELCCHAFDGIITLHSDEQSEGAYGFAGAATLAKHLLEPALAAAESILPRNRDSFIDGFPARRGIIRRGCHGALSAPKKVKPLPFEIAFHTPRLAPQFLQEQALVAALQTILVEYRNFVAYASNL